MPDLIGLVFFIHAACTNIRLSFYPSYFFFGVFSSRLQHGIHSSDRLKQTALILLNAASTISERSCMFPSKLTNDIDEFTIDKSL